MESHIHKLKNEKDAKNGQERANTLGTLKIRVKWAMGDNSLEPAMTQQNSTTKVQGVLHHLVQLSGPLESDLNP